MPGCHMKPDPVFADDSIGPGRDPYRLRETIPHPRADRAPVVVDKNRCWDAFAQHTAHHGDLVVGEWPVKALQKTEVAIAVEGDPGDAFLGTMK